MRTDEGLPEGEATVVGRDEPMCEHIEARSDENSAGEARQHGILEDATGEGDGLQTVRRSRSAGDIADQSRNGVMEPSTDRTDRNA